jgi:urea transport system ATP-binding protein
MLSIENANLHYGAAQALRGVSLRAEQAKITCVLGRNGVGKSSLMRAIVGHQPLSSGTILFEGKDFGRSAAYERSRAGVAYVPQGREIFPLLSGA